LKDVSCSGPHSHAVLLLKSFRNGAEISAMCGENFPSWFTTPINLRSSVTLVGGAICFRASSFCGSADMPFSLITWPRKVMELLVNSHLLGFRVSPAERIFAKTCLNRESCSSAFLPYTKMSSRWQSTPGKPKIKLICFSVSGTLLGRSRSKKFVEPVTPKWGNEGGKMSAAGCQGYLPKPTVCI